MARMLKVHHSSMGVDYTPVSTIILKGKWLEAAGFKIGDYVEVKCDGDTITLTKTMPPQDDKTLDEELMKLTKNERDALLKIITERK